VRLPDQILGAPKRWVFLIAQGLAQFVSGQAVAVLLQVVLEAPLPVGVVIGLATPLSDALVERWSAFWAPKILCRRCGRVGPFALAGRCWFGAFVFGIVRLLAQPCEAFRF